MSEPQAVAESAEEFLPGIWFWSVSDERIGGYISSAHAVRADDGIVLIDPLPLADQSFAGRGSLSAVCLTTSVHQRSTWRLRQELGVRVWAPQVVREIEEEPDERYSDGDSVPGGLRAVFTPGAGMAQHSFMLEREGGILFTPDLFYRPPGEKLAFVPAEYMHDPELARRTAEQLLDLDFAVLCSGHGVPVTDDPKSAIRGALAA